MTSLRILYSAHQSLSFDTGIIGVALKMINPHSAAYTILDLEWRLFVELYLSTPFILYPYHRGCFDNNNTPFYSVRHIGFRNSSLCLSYFVRHIGFEIAIYNVSCILKRIKYPFYRGWLYTGFRKASHCLSYFVCHIELKMTTFNGSCIVKRIKCTDKIDTPNIGVALKMITILRRPP